MRLEEARSRLCHGERLRRAGRRVQARAQLRAALALFERMRCEPWAERTESELRASGETLRTRGPGSPVDELTPQELQVATLAAAGLYQQGSRGAAVPVGQDDRGASAPHLQKARRPLARRTRATPGEAGRARVASLRRFADRIDTEKRDEPALLGVIVSSGHGYVRGDGFHVIPIGALGP